MDAPVNYILQVTVNPERPVVVYRYQKSEQYKNDNHDKKECDFFSYSHWFRPFIE
jgi:hypothetical protein